MVFCGWLLPLRVVFSGLVRLRCGSGLRPFPGLRQCSKGRTDASAVLVKARTFVTLVKEKGSVSPKPESGSWRLAGCGELRHLSPGMWDSHDNLENSFRRELNISFP